MFVLCFFCLCCVYVTSEHQAKSFTCDVNFFLDKDECMTDNNICGFGTCENLAGSYRCVCNRGYKYDETTKKCVG